MKNTKEEKRKVNIIFHSFPLFKKDIVMKQSKGPYSSEKIKKIHTKRSYQIFLFIQKAK